MEKRFTIIFYSIMMLLITSVCFAELSFYVNAEGVAEVSAPTFYIGSATDEILLINETTDYCASFGITGTQRVFKTEELDSSDFIYTPKVNFSIRAKVVGTTTPQDLILNFGYFDNNNLLHLIASETITVYDVLANFDIPALLGSEKPANIKEFYYEIEKGCLDCEYLISKCSGGFYTKVKLSK